MTASGERQATLSKTRNLKMARSAHAFVRGNTVQFYEWLVGLTKGALPEGPAVWICGDCHVGNLGPIANAKNRIQIQIRDLDQTVIGNPVHDLIRLGLSLASAARGFDLPGVTTARMIEAMVEGYERAFEPEWDGEDLEDAPSAVQRVIRQSNQRKWEHLAKERIKDTKPNIPLGNNFWSLEESERSKIEDLFAQPALQKLATTLNSRDDGAKVKVVDAAYWMKGCSSLGSLRYAVLLLVGKGGTREYCLMDVKEARAAAAPRYADGKMPPSDGERVVEGAKHLSPYLGQRVAAARLGKKSVFIRELRPQELKLEIEHLTTDEAVKTAFYLATVVGQAHSRQMSQESRRSWQKDLKKNRSKSLDAPSWLWRSVVSLLVSHEQAYLEHCRKYALAGKTAAS